MFNIIGMYINKLTKDDILKFSISKGANFSQDEIDFTYNFIKKNWKTVLKNPNLFDINRYSNHYSNINFLKLKQVYNEYLTKYGNSL